MLSYVARGASGTRVDGSNWGSPAISQGRAEFLGRGRDLTWRLFWSRLPDGKVGWLEGARPAHGGKLRVPLYDAVELAGRIEIPEGVPASELTVFVKVAADARTARPAADGTFRVPGLPPARLEVRV